VGSDGPARGVGGRALGGGGRALGGGGRALGGGGARNHEDVRRASGAGRVVAEDLAALYRELAVPLAQIVRAELRAPEAAIEEACQFAWSCLAQRPEAVGEATVLPWLATTARRELLRSLRRNSRECSLEAVLEQFGELEATSGCPLGREAPALEELIEQRERLRLVGALPRRQRGLLLLHAAGYSYAEIAARTGDSRRTVERQLLRAKRKARGLAF
jgi:RNA polymerase sigma factor (sigma-70 family)